MLINKSDIAAEILTIPDSNKPTKYSLQMQYPFNELSDEYFECLVYETLNATKEESLLEQDYDDCSMIVGAGDKGRDVVMLKNGSIVGVVQCKKYKQKLTKPQTVKEIIKFLLHTIMTPELLPDSSNFTYYLCVATGLNHSATELIDEFNTRVIQEEDLEKWVKEVIKENVRISVVYEDIADTLLNVLKKVKVRKLLPTTLTRLINAAPTVIATFFKVDKVIDKTSFLDIINDANLDIDRFKNDYSNNVINNYSRVNFFGLALPKKPREIQLYSLFVRPTFTARNVFMNLSWQDFAKEVSIIHESGKSQKAEIDFQRALNFLSKSESLFLSANHHSKSKSNTLLFEDLFSRDNNIVILGSPGAGKTSLIKYAMCKILEKDTTVFKNKAIYERIPFRVELHKYNKAKREDKIGIAGYLSNYLENELQVSYISKNAVERMVNDYNTVLFFDGLDEIFDVQERLGVRNDIENFTKNNTKCLSIVTSRFESYEEVFFNDRDFIAYNVNEFDQDRIIEYVNRWYSIEEDNKDVREEEINKCIHELEHKVEDELKTNPLLLSLILILYRNELEFPTSKLEIYQSCANTLIETRDTKEKKLEMFLKIENRSGIFSSIAYWIFATLNKKEQKKITHESVKRHITEYLLSTNIFNELHKAEEAAEEFLEYARLRSIFIETAFTHKTFLEYFAAHYIYTNFQAKGKIVERDNIIQTHVGQSSWSVVLELLLCEVDKQQSDYEVIDGIVAKLISLERFKAAHFFIQIIRFIKNISKDKIKLVVKTAIESCTSVRLDHASLRSINTHVVELAGYERFTPILKESYEELWKDLSNPEVQTACIIMHLENSIASKRYSNLKIHPPFDIDSSNDPYVFILYNYLNLLHTQEYFKVLDLFLSKFGKSNALKTYKSRFGYNVFWGFDTFNWCISCLFIEYNYTAFIENINRLNGFGITNTDIFNMLKHCPVKIGLTLAELDDYITRTNNAFINKVLKKIRFLVYGIKDSKSQERVAYYKQFTKDRKIRN